MSSLAARDDPVARTPAWYAGLPETMVFVDLETTGLTPSDRIVTFGAIRLKRTCLLDNRFDVDFAHLVFNPRRPNHPRAAAVHGYDDRVLLWQDVFAPYAPLLSSFVNSAQLVVAHNAAFDLAFLNRELTGARTRPIEVDQYCTMENVRTARPGMSAALDAVGAEIGLSRLSDDRHDAVEDAWLTMMIFLWLKGCPLYAAFPGRQMNMAVSNLRQAGVPSGAATSPPG